MIHHVDYFSKQLKYFKYIIDINTNLLDCYYFDWELTVNLEYYLSDWYYCWPDQSSNDSIEAHLHR